MIIIITGGIGSGKTLTAVKEILSRKNEVFTNFKLKNIKYTRLKQNHLFHKKKGKHKLNFDFWRSQTKKRNFDIYLDEFHNLMGSRRSMSKKNVLLSDWLSQIRKILGESEKNNLYLITQKLRRIDVNSRDLAHMAIKCEKQLIEEVPIPTEVINNKGKIETKQLPLCLIYLHYFEDSDALNAYENYGVNTCQYTIRFIANWFYKYYDSYELIDFGSEEYL
jgi:hypothetical protein